MYIHINSHKREISQTPPTLCFISSPQGKVFLHKVSLGYTTLILLVSNTPVGQVAYHIFFDEEVYSCVTLSRARLPKVFIISEEYLNISTQACTCTAMETGYYPVFRAYEYLSFLSFFLSILSRSNFDHHLRCGGWLNFEFSKREKHSGWAIKTIYKKLCRGMLKHIPLYQ